MIMRNFPGASAQPHLFLLQLCTTQQPKLWNLSCNKLKGWYTLLILPVSDRLFFSPWGIFLKTDPIHKHTLSQFLVLTIKPRQPRVKNLGCFSSTDSGIERREVMLSSSNSLFMAPVPIKHCKNILWLIVWEMGLSPSVLGLLSNWGLWE